jgi:hypothetical protein
MFNTFKQLWLDAGAQSNGSFEPLGDRWLRGEEKWLDHAHQAIDSDLL